MPYISSIGGSIFFIHDTEDRDFSTTVDGERFFYPDDYKPGVIQIVVEDLLNQTFPNNISDFTFDGDSGNQDGSLSLSVYYETDGVKCSVEFSAFGGFFTIVSLDSKIDVTNYRLNSRLLTLFSDEGFVYLDAQDAQETPYQGELDTSPDTITIYERYFSVCWPVFDDETSKSSVCWPME